VSIETKQGRFSALVGRTYSDIPRGQLGIIPGSQGYLEIAMRESSAAAGLDVKTLDQVKIRFS
jgi:S-adenosylmethionine hydrolase